MSEEKREKWVFIVNPISGNCFGETMIPVIQEKIEKYGLDAEILVTERPGHATEYALASAAKGVKFIIAVGGDGTLNEVARALLGKNDVVTGIIPAGTGNDFNQIPGFPDRFNDSDWDIFMKKNTIGHDVGVVNDMIFLNGLGIGFDAEVAAQNYNDEGKVRKGGNDKYIWHIVKTLLFFREQKMIVKSDGNDHETECFMNTVSIGRRFAGSFFLTPEAIANDGLLDVCSISRVNLFNRFRLLLMVPKGKHIFDKRVHYFKTPAVKLSFPQRVPFHVDGELSFADTFDIRIIPEGLRIIYNPDGKHYYKRG